MGIRQRVLPPSYRVQRFRDDSAHKQQTQVLEQANLQTQHRTLVLIDYSKKRRYSSWLSKVKILWFLMCSPDLYGCLSQTEKFCFLSVSLLFSPCISPFALLFFSSPHTTSFKFRGLLESPVGFSSGGHFHVAICERHFKDDPSNSSWTIDYL